MPFSGSVIDLLDDCWKLSGFFIPCAQTMPAKPARLPEEAVLLPSCSQALTPSPALLSAQTSGRDTGQAASFAGLVLAHVSQITKVQHKHLCWHTKRVMGMRE